MTKIYDVVCPRCGEIHQWWKYDPPLERCVFCGYKLSCEGDDGTPLWKDDAHVFGVWSTSIRIREVSKMIRKQRLTER